MSVTQRMPRRLAFRAISPDRLSSAAFCRTARAYSSTAAPSSAAERIFSGKPKWSMHSLFDWSGAAASPGDTITSAQLHHLLRLAALPPPANEAAEAAMLATLHDQLQFVRAVQRVDTKGVEPLSAIRDEVAPTTVGLEDMKPLLDAEVKVGYYQRPKRARRTVESAAEDWDALAMASRKEGRYFVVESGSSKKEGGES